jgi:DNA-binding NtrC family response regulator
LIIFLFFEFLVLLLLNRKFYELPTNSNTKMAKKAIVADDRPEWRENYAWAITSNFPDVEVDEVESGSELVDRVLSGDYCLAISDNDMEGHGDGLRALKAIREAGNQTPLYVISGRSIGDEARSLGANGFYDKARFDSDIVLEDMAQYLK